MLLWQLGDYNKPDLYYITCSKCKCMLHDWLCLPKYFHYLLYFKNIDRCFMSFLSFSFFEKKKKKKH